VVSVLFTRSDGAARVSKSRIKRLQKVEGTENHVIIRRKYQFTTIARKSFHVRFSASVSWKTA